MKKSLIALFLYLLEILLLQRRPSLCVMVCFSTDRREDSATGRRFLSKQEENKSKKQFCTRNKTEKLLKHLFVLTFAHCENSNMNVNIVCAAVMILCRACVILSMLPLTQGIICVIQCFAVYVWRHVVKIYSSLINCSFHNPSSTPLQRHI